MTWPSVAEERLGSLAERAATWRANGWIFVDQKQRIEAAAASPWRRHSLPMTITFFVLTCLGVAAFSVFLELIHLPYGPMALLASIGCAEFLIRMYHLQRTGVESALWISGLCAFIIWLPSQHTPEGILAFAAAAMVTGARLRSAVFLALSAVLIDVYTDTKTHEPWATVGFALVVTAIAAVAIAREWRRPSTELMFSLLVIVMLPTAYLSSKMAWPIAVAGIALLAEGIIIRHRALLISGTIGVALGGFDLAKQLSWPLEAKFAAGGVVILTIAIALTRKLRNNTRGFVIEKTAARFDPTLLATLAMAPVVAPPAQAAHLEDGGGSFGGGGATGDV